MNEQTRPHPAGKWRTGLACPRCDKPTVKGCGTPVCPVADIIERRKPISLRGAAVGGRSPAPVPTRPSAAALLAQADAFPRRFRPDRYDDDDWVGEHLNDALGG